MRIREWELDAGTSTFIARDKREIMGVISLAPEIEGAGLPSESLYPAECAELRRISGRIAEACNGVIAQPYRGMPFTFEFYRCLLAQAWHAGIDKIIGVTNKNHGSFYEFLYMVRIGDVKNYAHDMRDPVILMCLDCENLLEYLSSPASDNGTADSFLREVLLFNNPYIKLVAKWEERAIDAFVRERIGRRFMDESRNLLVDSILGEMSGCNKSVIL